MHSTVLVQFKNSMVKTKGDGLWMAISEKAGFDPEKKFDTEFDEEYFDKIMDASAAVLNRPRHIILVDLGYNLVKSFIKNNLDKIDKNWNTIDFIDNIEEIFKSNDDVSPPIIRSVRKSENTIIIFYEANEHYTSLLEGFIKGVSKHFNQYADIKCTGCTEETMDHCFYEISLLE